MSFAMMNKKNLLVLPTGVTEPAHLPSTKLRLFLFEDVINPCIEAGNKMPLRSRPNLRIRIGMDRVPLVSHFFIGVPDLFHFILPMYFIYFCQSCSPKDIPTRKHAYIILIPYTPLLYSKTVVYRGMHYFSYFCSKT